MISVIVPLYNKETAILTTLSSIQEQSFKDWECLIVDDGSTDKSAKVVQGFIKDDVRFIYYYKPNGGPSSARNYGVKKAKFEWVIFLDADDRFEEDAFAQFVRLQQQHSAIKMFCCNFYVERDGKRTLFSQNYSDGIIKNNFKSWYEGSFMPCQGAAMYKKQILLDHPLNEQLRRFEDASMLFDIMRTERIYRCSQPSFTYVRENSSASGIRKDFQEDFFAHLQPKGKPFWEQMILYQYYKASFTLYGEQARKTYPHSPFNLIMELAIKGMLNWLKIKNRVTQKFCK